MATLSSDKTYVTVQKGDTLSAIALKYLGSASKYKQLAAVNNIKNPNRIYVGQKIYLTKTSSGRSSKKVANQATVTMFGLQSNSDNTLFAVWTWSKHKYTEHYKYIWKYATGDGHGFIGSEGTTEHGESTYSIPSNATRVTFQVLPVSKKRKVNKKDKAYFTGVKWSTVKTFEVSSIPPSAPTTPTVAIDKFKFTASLDNIDTSNAKQVQFEVVKNDKTVFSISGYEDIITSHAEYTCTVEAGHEYKARARLKRGSLYSDWSEYSSNVGTIPSAPSRIIHVKALSETVIQLKWEQVPSATSFEIEYTTDRRYFNSSSDVKSMTSESPEYAEITGLESGREYFFRVRAVNEKGKSSWSDEVSGIVGKKPAPPTTWSSTTTAIVGEPLNLYWIHNSEDGSSQSRAELEVITSGTKKTYTITKNGEYQIDASGTLKTIAEYSEEDKDKTTNVSVVTTGYSEGTTVQWKARTAGITSEYGEWSVQRSIDVYAPPTLELSLTDVNGTDISTLTSFPMYIKGLAGPNTQRPIGYHIVITAKSSYETTDEIGNVKIVKEGDEVYSKYFDTNEQLILELSANHIDLENNIEYTLSGIVSMNSGLTAESSKNFTVSWSDLTYQPNAELGIDDDTLTASIRPYCEETYVTYYNVTNNSGVYTKTTTTFDSVWGEQIPNAKTTTGEDVYYGMTDEGVDTYFCEVETTTIVEGIKLSVYRREYDGTFTEIATGIQNGKNTFVTDPHPALDYARYRIVAITDSTGAVSYCDIPGVPVNEASIVIQWAEEWSEFSTTNEDALERPPWVGSMIKLPYNIDVSDNISPDVSLVEYIGRKHPVSYYGTQVGETASWSADIDKEDKDTLYALRRLRVWMGNVYVREPSGSGYWANVNVSFKQSHDSLVIPVTISITRVEGGA